MSRFVVSIGSAGMVPPSGCIPVKDLAQLGRELIWLGRRSVLAAREAIVDTRELDRRLAEAFSECRACPAGPHVARLLTDPQHDPGRGRPEGVEVVLVVVAGDDVLPKQHVGPRAIVLRRQAE